MSEAARLANAERHKLGHPLIQIRTLTGGLAPRGPSRSGRQELGTLGWSSPTVTSWTPRILAMAENATARNPCQVRFSHGVTELHIISIAHSQPSASCCIRTSK